MRAFNKKKKPKHSITKVFKHYDLMEGKIVYGMATGNSKRQGFVIESERRCSFKLFSLEYWKDYYKDFPRLKFETKRQYEERYFNSLYKEVF